jgi:PAS domain S-box-containing protein
VVNLSYVWSDSLRLFFSPSNLVRCAIAILILCGLYLISLQNYLLFHSIVELATIVIIFAIFVIVWNTRRSITNTFFLVIGISFLFVGGIDLIHMLAYKGMGVFLQNSSDLPTQLWIAARYFQSIAFFVATLLIGKYLTKDRKYDAVIIFAVCAAAFVLILTSIFVWKNFPPCFVEGVGLTPFKITSEYIISVIMLATIVLLLHRRRAFDPAVWKLLVAAMVFLIAGELAFTSYISVYGFMNMLGHLFKLVSVYFFYRAIVVVGITRPFDLLFRELKENEETLRKSELQYRSLFDSMIEGHALHEIILDENGQATEYRILDVNSAFEKLLNVHRKDIIGKLSCEAYGVNEPPYLKIYAHVAVSGKNEIFETYFSPMEKHFMISVYSPQKGQFATIFEDITERKRTEEALRESEKNYRQLIELAQEGIWTIDKEANTTFVNARMAEILGYTAEEMRGRSLFAFMDEHGVALAQANIERRRQGIREQHDFEFIRKDGKRVYTSLETTPLTDETGAYIGALAVVADITERKQASDALRASTYQLKLILDSTAEAIYGLDMNGNCTFCNTACLCILGYTHPDELIGKNMHWQIHHTHPDGTSFPIEECRIFKAFQKGEGTHVNDEVLWRADGTSFPAEYWSYPQRRDGAIVGAVVTFLDITERKKADNALRETKDYLENLIGYANAPIIVWNSRFEITEFNHAFEILTGLSRGEVIGQPLSILFPVESREKSLDLIRQTLAGERLETVEIPIHHVSGATHIVLWNSANVLDSLGTVIATVAQGQDVTERVQSAEALRNANRQLNLLSSITRHDILNQLTALRGYLELSHDVINDPKTLLGFLEKEEQAAGTIQRQITFTKDYQDLGAAAPVWQNVNTSITKAVAGLPMRAVRVNVDKHDLEIYADPLFEKVFYNLIDNALRYGGEQMTTIQVSSQESDSGLTILCEDDGVGIAEEDKKRLFTRGFGKNTGLGLFLSREILSITGITITENGTLGKGARFEINVPKGGYRFTGTG